MKNNIRIATARFENKSGDKKYNLPVIEKFAGEASEKGAEAIAFHECSITGYTFARNLSKEQMLDLAEYIPGGESIIALTAIAAKYNIAVLAGLFEKSFYRGGQLEGQVYAYIAKDTPLIKSPVSYFEDGRLQETRNDSVETRYNTDGSIYQVSQYRNFKKNGLSRTFLAGKRWLDMEFADGYKTAG